MGEDEQCPAVRATEQHLQRPLGDIDPPRFLAVCSVDEHLPVRDEHAALIVDRHTLAAAIGEGLQIGQVPPGPIRPL